MKSILSFLFLSLFFSVFIQAQAYIKVGGGYGFSVNTEQFTNPSLSYITDSTGVDRLFSNTNTYGSLGAGGQIKLSGGYVFQQNFGFDLEMHYLFGQKKMVQEIIKPGNRTEMYYAYTQQFRLAPSFFVRANKGIVQPYAGAGIVLPLAGYTYLEYQKTDPNLDLSFTQVRRVSGSPTVGFEGYIGAQVKWPNENFNFFFEVRYTGLRIKSKSAEMIQWDEVKLSTGEVTNELETASVFNTQIQFVDEINNNSNASVFSGGFLVSPDLNKPMEKLASSTNFNTLQFNLGICIQFTKKENK